VSTPPGARNVVDPRTPPRPCTDARRDGGLQSWAPLTRRSSDRSAGGQVLARRRRRWPGQLHRGLDAVTPPGPPTRTGGAPGDKSSAPPRVCRLVSAWWRVDTRRRRPPPGPRASSRTCLPSSDLPMPLAGHPNGRGTADPVRSVAGRGFTASEPRRNTGLCAVQDPSPPVLLAQHAQHRAEVPHGARPSPRPAGWTTLTRRTRPDRQPGRRGWVSADPPTRVGPLPRRPAEIAAGRLVHETDCGVGDPSHGSVSSGAPPRAPVSLGTRWEVHQPRPDRNPPDLAVPPRAPARAPAGRSAAPRAGGSDWRPEATAGPTSR
jgi:hypothetical protein